MVLTILVAAAFLAVLTYLTLKKKNSKLQGYETPQQPVPVNPTPVKEQRSEPLNAQSKAKEGQKNTAVKKEASKKPTPTVKKTKVVKNGK